MVSPEGSYAVSQSPKRYRTEDEARKAAQTLANRWQREIAIAWSSNEGTQRRLVCKIAPNRRKHVA